MDSNRLWSPAFTNYGISSGILYMTQYVLVAALPIVITSELAGSDLDAGLAMTYFQIGTILCRIFAGRLIDGFRTCYRSICLMSRYVAICCCCTPKALCLSSSVCRWGYSYPPLPPHSKRLCSSL